MVHRNGFIRVSRLSVLVLAAAVLLCACDRAPAPQAVEPDRPLARIVSLAPELTRIVVDLGKGDLLVGVCTDDPAAPKGLKTVGDYRHVSEETLIALHPTLVLTMYGQEGPDTRLDDLGRLHHFRVCSYPSPHRVSEMEEMIAEPEALSMGNSGHGIGAVLGNYEAGWKLKVKVQMELGALEHLTLEINPKPTVLLLIGTHPLMAVGPESVHNDILCYDCGGRNAAWNLVGNAPQISRERVVEGQPDIIVLIQPNGEALKGIDQDERLSELRGLDVPAVKNHKIFLFNDPLAMLESSCLPGEAAKLAKLIHPELAKAIDAALVASTQPKPQSTGAATTKP